VNYRTGTCLGRMINIGLILVAILAVVFLCVAGISLTGAADWFRAQETPVAVQPTPAVVTPPVVQDAERDVTGNGTAPGYIQETPEVAQEAAEAQEQEVAPTPIPTEVPQPTPLPEGVFDYRPGGEGFGEVADDINCPEGLNDCIRVWQATNLKNFAWTFGLANFQASDPAPKMQWPHPTQFTVTGTGVVEFDLFRDHGAIQQLRDRGQYNGRDPYDVANAQNSPLGLGWFAQGFNGQICVNGECQELDGGGVFQLGFPRNMQGSYRVRLSVESGQLQFWQGEKFTTTDNWPLPEGN
jgi:hypothetical protein